MAFDHQEIKFTSKPVSIQERMNDSQKLIASRKITTFSIGFAIGITLGQLVHLANFLAK
mgnify:CR=1 FL=1